MSHHEGKYVADASASMPLHQVSLTPAPLRDPWVPMIALVPKSLRATDRAESGPSVLPSCTTLGQLLNRYRQASRRGGSLRGGRRVFSLRERMRIGIGRVVKRP
jgi:hypothetical protein